MKFPSQLNEFWIANGEWSSTYLTMLWVRCDSEIFARGHFSHSLRPINATRCFGVGLSRLAYAFFARRMGWKIAECGTPINHTNMIISFFPGFRRDLAGASRYLFFLELKTYKYMRNSRRVDSCHCCCNLLGILVEASCRENYSQWTKKKKYKPEV